MSTRALARGRHVVELDKDQANYLVNVLRLKDGDSVVLFNGRDGAWLSKLDPRRQERRDARAASCRSRTRRRRPTSGSASRRSKIGRLDYLVQKATEMGAGDHPARSSPNSPQARTKPDKLHA